MTPSKFRFLARWRFHEIHVQLRRSKQGSKRYYFLQYLKGKKVKWPINFISGKQYQKGQMATLFNTEERNDEEVTIKSTLFQRKIQTRSTLQIILTLSLIITSKFNNVQTNLPKFYQF